MASNTKGCVIAATVVAVLMMCCGGGIGVAFFMLASHVDEVVAVSSDTTNGPPPSATSPVSESSPPTASAVAVEEISPAKGLPSEDEARTLATQTLLDLAAALHSGDFATLTAQFSAPLQTMATTAEFGNTLTTLKHRQSGFADLTAAELGFTDPPTINEYGELQIVGAFNRGLVRVAFRFKYLDEDNQWKLIGIKIVALPSDEAIPEPEDLRKLVALTLLNFNAALQAKEFTAFHGKLTKTWQARETIEDLNRYLIFNKEGLNLSAVKDRDVRTTTPAINDKGFLEVKGNVLADPGLVTFDLKYALEYSSDHPEWRLQDMGIELAYFEK